MRVEFDNSLTTQRFYAAGSELKSILGREESTTNEELVAEILNPRLMTDFARIARLDPLTRDNLMSLIAGTQIQVTYDNYTLTFDKKKLEGVWSPSIDTLLLSKHAREHLTHEKRIAEVGAGSGFIGAYAQARVGRNNETPHLDLYDILPQAVKCWEVNTTEPTGMHIGDAKELLFEEAERNGVYDAIFCNPPYIPRPKVTDMNAYEGLDLALELIKNAPKVLTRKGALLMVASDLAEKHYHAEAEYAEIKMEVLKECQVPLKVQPIRNNADWVEYLKEQGLESRPNSDYELWQTIKVYKFTNQ